MSKISVIIKRPNSKPYHTNIENTLHNFQQTVGGYIEVVNITDDMALIVNEEGRIRLLEPNFTLFGTLFVGTAIFVGIHGDEFCDIPLTFAEFKKMLPQLWEVSE